MRKLIYGCGYLGIRVARRWLAEGSRVEAVTRANDRAAMLQREGLVPILSDVVHPTTLPRLDQYDTVLYAIGYDRQAGANMRAVYVQGLTHALFAGDAPPNRLIYISSTGVYGDAGGDWIDEGTECNPLREGGRICLEAERVLAAHPFASQSIILRMAGIYGPGRVPRQKELLAGQPIASPQEGALNLIHIDDAVEVILAAERRAPLPSLYVVADGAPVSRGDYFRAMAELLCAAPPRFEYPPAGGPAAERARTDKRIRNDKMLRDLAVTLRYPTYREGLAAILENNQRDSAIEPAK